MHILMKQTNYINVLKMHEFITAYLVLCSGIQDIQHFKRLKMILKLVLVMCSRRAMKYTDIVV